VSSKIDLQIFKRLSAAASVDCCDGRLFGRTNLPNCENVEFGLCSILSKLRKGMILARRYWMLAVEEGGHGHKCLGYCSFDSNKTSALFFLFAVLFPIPNL
jgi:hypothetical protein